MNGGKMSIQKKEGFDRSFTYQWNVEDDCADQVGESQIIINVITPSVPTVSIASATCSP